LFKNTKIGTQIIVVSFLLVLISVACALTIAIEDFSDYMHTSVRAETQRSVAAFKRTIEGEMERIRAFRNGLCESQELARLVAERDLDGLYYLTKPLIDAAKVSILVIADADGVIIARPYDRYRIGDNVGSNPDAEAASKGKPYELFMSGASTKLGFYCGGPIQYDGKMVGTLRAAFSLEDTRFVDEIKTQFGVEATMFAGKTRISTTLQENGQRLVGTDAPQAVIDQVLKGGKDYVDEMEIAGHSYFADYVPLKDPGSGETVGMLFTGKSVTGISSAIKSSIVTVGTSGVIVLIVALVVSYAVAKRISKPLERIAELSERGSHGDLTITMEDFGYSGQGELGMLVESLSGMIESQRNVISRVVSTSDLIVDHTATLAAVLQENNDAMHRVKSLTEEVSRLCGDNAEAVKKGNMGMSEMAEEANSVAKMSVSGAEFLAKTTKISKEAMESMDDLAGHIDMVDKRTIENQKKIRELSVSVSEISSFMNVIASIADQTNLLALNAAIEAARAGEAGRGFAVVAEEVRKLAEESRNASKSVEVLVSTLSQSAGDAISATEDSVTIVHQIMTMAGTTADGLNTALKEITNTSDSIQAIAAVAEEQAAASAEINSAIDAIHKSTEQIAQKMSGLHNLSDQASSIGKTASLSAKEMSDSAEELEELLSHFKMSPA
jgi:methyl-accepting chemotaxis protein